MKKTTILLFQTYLERVYGISATISRCPSLLSYECWSTKYALRVDEQSIKPTNLQTYKIGFFYREASSQI